MPPWVREFYRDERGSLLVVEWVFIATILMLSILSSAASVCSQSQQSASNEINSTIFYGTKKAD